MSDELIHYGTKTHSGRYPWGSGENPYQRLGKGSIRARMKELQENGLSEKEIADSLHMSTTVLRQLVTLEKNEEANQIYYRSRDLKEKGWSNVAIASELGVSEATVRNYLKADKEAKVNQLQNITNELKNQVSEKQWIDIGEGSNYALNCSENKMKAAVKLLEMEDGYEVHNIRVPQLGTNHKTTMMILTPPGTETKDIYNNLDKVHEIDESRLIKTDGTISLKMERPRAVDRDRIMVRYAEDGGKDKDGTIELRRGVDDISLGQANYAQVRINVEDKGYMKGMAFYNDNMPDGVDIIYNSKRHKGAPDYEGEGAVFKKIKMDADNPFGANIKGLHDKDLAPEDRELKLTQRYYKDKNGKEQLSCINVVNEEGTWDSWGRNLSSQFLSKQTPALAKRQLDIAYKSSVAEYDEIMKLTEPTVKRNLLESFAENCDAAASELKAAALPRQRTSVILPVPTLKDNEIYAPQYNNGERVCLVRHPHGGIFEIPELIVNNNHKEGKAVVGSARDAVGINVNTAAKLSGADFDGDTVLVLPSNNVKIKTADINKTPGLEILRGFDTEDYAYPPNTPHVKMSNATKQLEMGKVSNLITDMTIMGAPNDKIARAVKHSMVIIDAEKHDLNYKQSEKDNDIASLKKEYQGGALKGAATIISRASSEKRVPERKEYTKIDPKTGEVIYTETGRTYEERKAVKDKNGNFVKDANGNKVYRNTGKIVEATTKTTKMAVAKDAYELTSDKKGGYPMERIYADHANKMKALANQARRESLGVVDREYSPSAKSTYAAEVSSLEGKLLLAKKNAPRERQAQLVANSSVKAQLAANPEYKDDPDKVKKIKGQALSSARATVGAKKYKITFTDREWEAIQAGALTKSKLKSIIQNADDKEVKERSMPKANITLTASKKSQIKALLATGYTQSEVADMLGLSISTISKVSME